MASGEGGCEVMVEYEYTAEQDDELSVKPGDIIIDVKKASGGWWEGTLNGKRGMFPDNFVKEIKKEKFQPDKRDKVKKAPPSQKVPESGGTPTSQGSASNVVKRPGNSAKKKRRAKVTYSYTPVNEDELGLSVGNVVEVTDMEEEGWWQGILDGKEGVFPSNFVELLSDTEKGEDNEGKDLLIKGKKVKGIGLGVNIFEGGMPKLKATKKTGSTDDLSASVSPPIPAEPVKKPVPKAHPLPISQTISQVPSQASAPIIESKPVEKAKVLFAYNAENDDELSLEEGQIIVVLDKDLQDSGWWKGRIDGREGVFPDNFVELLPPEESKPKRPGGTLGKNIRPPVEPDKEIDQPTDHDKNKTVVKRPGPPPPLGKKPSKNTDHKTDDHKAQEQQSESAEPNPKLKHLTKERPKPPVNRQPASVKVTPTQKEGQSRPVPVHSNSLPEGPTTDNSSPRNLISPPLVNTQHTGDIPAKAPAAAASAEVIELRKQVEALRENSVPRKQYDELKAQFTQLKSQVEQMKKTFDKKLYDVMVEVDEEKKNRIGLQVEVERVKKLVSPPEL